MVIFRVRITGLNKLYQIGKLDENLDEILVFGDVDPERVSRWYPPTNELRKAMERYNKLVTGIVQTERKNEKGVINNVYR